MRSKILASLLAASVLAPASPTYASVADFRLPGDQPQQEPVPDAQGPVAPDVPASRRVRAAPTPTAAANGDETPVAEPAAPAIEVPTELQAAPASSRQTAAPVATSRPAATAAASAAPAAEQAPTTRPQTGRQAESSATAPPAPARSAAFDGEGGRRWLWLAVPPLGLAILGLAFWAIRRRPRRPVARVAVPPIERPRVEPARPSPAPVAPSAPAEPLQLSLEPLRLALTLVNATLVYRLELANLGPAAVTGLVIGADMISAHASISREEQLSGPRPGDGVGGASVQRIDRLEAGESRVLEGEFRLPFPQIVPIRQGNAALLLPLARLRVEADGAAPMVRTFAIGQPGQGNGLQPFRLDQGPRIYPRLTQHAFA